MPVVLIGGNDNQYAYPTGIQPGDPILAPGNKRIGRVASRKEVRRASPGQMRGINLKVEGVDYTVPVIMDQKALNAAAQRVYDEQGPEGKLDVVIRGRKYKGDIGRESAEPIAQQVPTHYGDYSRVLDAQLDMIRFTQTQQGIDWIANLSMEDEGNARYWIRTMLTTLKHGTPFFVTSQICDYLIASTPHLHTQPLLEEMLPAYSGFVFFDKPMPLPDVPLDPYTDDMEGEEPWHDDIHAIGWIKVELEGGTYHDYGENKPGVVFTYFARPQGRSLRPALCFWVTFGDTQEDYVKDSLRIEKMRLGFANDEDEPRHEHWNKVRRLRLNYTYGLLRFLQERILIPSTPYRANRATRKRVEHEHLWSEEPMIRILEFRKSVRTQSDHDAKRAGWRLMHSFTVGEGTGGFYQTYHTRNGPIRLKIEPYPKGIGLPPKRGQVTIGVVRR